MHNRLCACSTHPGSNIKINLKCIKKYTHSTDRLGVELWKGSKHSSYEANRIPNKRKQIKNEKQEAKYKTKQEKEWINSDLDPYL